MSIKNIYFYTSQVLRKAAEGFYENNKKESIAYKAFLASLFPRKFSQAGTGILGLEVLLMLQQVVLYGTEYNDQGEPRTEYKVFNSDGIKETMKFFDWMLENVEPIKKSSSASAKVLVKKMIAQLMKIHKERPGLGVSIVVNLNTLEIQDQLMRNNPLQYIKPLALGNDSYLWEWTTDEKTGKSVWERNKNVDGKIITLDFESDSAKEYIQSYLKAKVLPKYHASNVQVYKAILNKERQLEISTKPEWFVDICNNKDRNSLFMQPEYGQIVTSTPMMNIGVSADVIAAMKRYQRYLPKDFADSALYQALINEVTYYNPFGFKLGKVLFAESGGGSKLGTRLQKLAQFYRSKELYDLHLKLAYIYSLDYCLDGVPEDSQKYLAVSVFAAAGNSFAISEKAIEILKNMGIFRMIGNKSLVTPADNIVFSNRLSSDILVGISSNKAQLLANAFEMWFYNEVKENHFLHYGEKWLEFLDKHTIVKNNEGIILKDEKAFIDEFFVRVETDITINMHIGENGSVKDSHTLKAVILESKMTAPVFVTNAFGANNYNQAISEDVESEDFADSSGEEADDNTKIALLHAPTKEYLEGLLDKEQYKEACKKLRGKFGSRRLSQRKQVSSYTLHALYALMQVVENPQIMNVSKFLEELVEKEFVKELSKHSDLYNYNCGKGKVDDKKFDKIVDAIKFYAKMYAMTERLNFKAGDGEKVFVSRNSTSVKLQTLPINAITVQFFLEVFGLTFQFKTSEGKVFVCPTVQSFLNIDKEDILKIEQVKAVNLKALDKKTLSGKIKLLKDEGVDILIPSPEQIARGLQVYKPDENHEMPLIGFSEHGIGLTAIIVLLMSLTKFSLWQTTGIPSVVTKGRQLEREYKGLVDAKEAAVLTALYYRRQDIAKEMGFKGDLPLYEISVKDTEGQLIHLQFGKNAPGVTNPVHVSNNAKDTQFDLAYNDKDETLVSAAQRLELIQKAMRLFYKTSEGRNNISSRLMTQLSGALVPIHGLPSEFLVVADEIYAKYYSKTKEVYIPWYKAPPIMHDINIVRIISASMAKEMFGLSNDAVEAINVSLAFGVPYDFTLHFDDADGDMGIGWLITGKDQIEFAKLLKEVGYKFGYYASYTCNSKIYKASINYVNDEMPKGAKATKVKPVPDYTGDFGKVIEYSTYGYFYAQMEVGPAATNTLLYNKQISIMALKEIVKKENAMVAGNGSHARIAIITLWMIYLGLVHNEIKVRGMKAGAAASVLSPFGDEQIHPDMYKPDYIAKIHKEKREHEDMTKNAFYSVMCQCMEEYNLSALSDTVNSVCHLSSMYFDLCVEYPEDKRTYYLTPFKAINTNINLDSLAYSHTNSLPYQAAKDILITDIDGNDYNYWFALYGLIFSNSQADFYKDYYSLLRTILFGKITKKEYVHYVGGQYGSDARLVNISRKYSVMESFDMNLFIRVDFFKNRNQKAILIAQEREAKYDKIRNIMNEIISHLPKDTNADAGIELLDKDNVIFKFDTSPYFQDEDRTHRFACPFTVDRDKSSNRVFVTSKRDILNYYIVWLVKGAEYFSDSAEDFDILSMYENNRQQTLEIIKLGMLEQADVKAIESNKPGIENIVVILSRYGLLEQVELENNPQVEPEEQTKTVVISGSRSIEALPEEALNSLRKIVEGGYLIYIGDNPKGVDALVQDFLASEGYGDKVTVWHTNNTGCRYNAGDFNTHSVSGNFTQRDTWMHEKVDFGLAIWDCVSKDTKRNIDQLAAQGTPTRVIYVCNDNGGGDGSSNKAPTNNKAPSATNKPERKETNTRSSSNNKTVKQQQASLPEAPTPLPSAAAPTVATTTTTVPYIQTVLEKAREKHLVGILPVGKDGYTDGQRLARKFILDNLNNKYLVLTGVPGAGKSYLLTSMIDDNGFLDETRVLMTAPSNAACLVLAKMLQDKNLSVTVIFAGDVVYEYKRKGKGAVKARPVVISTFQHILTAEVRADKDGKKEFCLVGGIKSLDDIASKYFPEDKFIWIADESSFASSKYLDIIEKDPDLIDFLNAKMRSMIISGDHQLPPVVPEEELKYHNYSKHPVYGNVVENMIVASMNKKGMPSHDLIQSKRFETADAIGALCQLVRKGMETMYTGNGNSVDYLYNFINDGKLMTQNISYNGQIEISNMSEAMKNFVRDNIKISVSEMSVSLKKEVMYLCFQNINVLRYNIEIISELYRMTKSVTVPKGLKLIAYGNQYISGDSEAHYKEDGYSKAYNSISYRVIEILDCSFSHQTYSPTSISEFMRSMQDDFKAYQDIFRITDKALLEELGNDISDILALGFVNYITKYLQDFEAQMAKYNIVPLRVFNESLGEEQILPFVASVDGLTLMKDPLKYMTSIWNADDDSYEIISDKDQNTGDTVYYIEGVRPIGKRNRIVATPFVFYKAAIKHCLRYIYTNEKLQKYKDNATIKQIASNCYTFGVDILMPLLKDCIIWPNLIPGYAMTIHRSQGSTFKEAVVLNDFTWRQKEGDLAMVSALLYVAASRVKEKVTFVIENKNYSKTDEGDVDEDI